MSKPTKILRLALLVLVAGGVGVWAWRGFGPGGGTDAPVAPAPADAPVAPEPADCVLVTYFTTDQRCPTCLKIEQQTRAAVEAGFAGELAGGQVRFQTLNLDRPENRHFATDYQLAFKTVVVAERRGGREARWEKFDKVWDLVDEPDAFATYLQDGVRRHLKPDTDA